MTDGSPTRGSLMDQNEPVTRETLDPFAVQHADNQSRLFDLTDDGHDGPGNDGPDSGDAEPTGPGWKQTIAAAAVAALVGAGVAVPTTLALSGDESPTVPQPSRAAAVVEVEGDDSLVTAIAKTVSPSVVRVNAGQGSGSGVIYTQDGYVLTNAHVVARSRDASIVLPDGRRFDAEIVGADARSDVAVLKVDATDLPVPAFAAGAPEVGETVVAIGSPFGLDGSVTAGIVSATNRTVPGSGTPLVDMLQTDAAINPGNSGGALVNSRGEVLGINTAIISGSGRGNDGIGFAIPIDTARNVADQLIETGSVSHPFLGIMGQAVDPAIAELYNLPVDQGVVVAETDEDGPAARAGLQRGDIIIALDDSEVTDMNTLLAAIARHSPGDEVTLTIVRGGEEQQLEVTLGERPSS